MSVYDGLYELYNHAKFGEVRSTRAGCRCEKVLWSSACVYLCVCLCALFLSARYLKNGFMDHHQIWWVGAGGEPIEQVQFWC